LLVQGQAGTFRRIQGKVARLCRLFACAGVDRRVPQRSGCLSLSKKESDMTNRHLLVIAGMALATSAAFAQGSYDQDQPRHDHASWREQQRSAEQEQRIRDGQANGSITPREAAYLLDQQREIRHVEWRANRDGVLTPDERRQIRAMQDRADRTIDRMETNRHAY
jgi:hypothetical protein